jgi:uncharacterized membrane protein YfcA
VSATLVAAASFLMLAAGGMVKGALGVGLPLVSVPLLSLIIPPSQAMGLMVLPVVASNIQQAWQGGWWKRASRRFAPLLLAQAVVTIGIIELSRGWPTKWLDMAVAVTVVLAVLGMNARPQAGIPPRHETWAGIVVGALAGIMAGLSSLPGPMIITYLVALRLPREEFVGSISVIYLIGAIPTYAGMLFFGRFELVDVGWSCVAMVPAWAGLYAGTRIRERLNEKQFRIILQALLVILAGVLFLR